MKVEIKAIDANQSRLNYAEILRELARGLDAGHYGGSGTYYLEDANGKRFGTITLTYQN